MKPLRHCILPESEPQVKQKGGWNIGLVRQDELALSPDYPYNVGAGYVTEGHQHGGGGWSGFQVVAGFDTGITIKDCADNMRE